MSRTVGTAFRKLQELTGYPLYMPLFVACELHAGARLSQNPEKELAKIERLNDLMELVTPDRTFALAYGENEANLRRQGQAIPTVDLLIATLAKLHGLPLLTRDAEHYRRIPGLVVEEYGP
jgi:tRNA(fMet)-specific endonuclease VapC